MQRRTFWTAAAATMLALPLCTSVLAAQGVPLHSEDMPLAKDIGIPSGQDVTPAWEGWYPMPDGSNVIYFGYYNRNSEEVVHVPVGPDNQVTVGGEVVDAGQPTDFQPGREWGVFGVKVPADFNDEVVWTIRSAGRTLSIPGSLNPTWLTDVIAGDADGNFPPTLRFQENGTEGEGPLGLEGPPQQATVGVPIEVTVWGSHVGPAESGPAAAAGSGGFGGGGRGGRGGGPPQFQVRWYKHSGPGGVTFSEPTGNIPGDGGMATTEVTFDTPGTYVLRVTAAQGGMVGQGHGQCCWTNGFVEVTVTEG